MNTIIVHSILYFRLYIYGLFCQHVYKKTKKQIETADVYMCAKCSRVMALQK